MLNSCGTHFVDEFSSGKQAYLENVLVVQNEPGIQEVSLGRRFRSQRTRNRDNFIRSGLGRHTQCQVSVGGQFEQSSVYCAEYRYVEPGSGDVQRRHGDRPTRYPSNDHHNIILLLF